MDYFQKEIYHDIWTFYLLDEGDNLAMDECDNAVTDTETLEVHFRKAGVREEEVRHETWHIIKHYCFTETAELTAHQEEEISAELYSFRGKLMDKLSSEILAELIKLRDNKE